MRSMPFCILLSSLLMGSAYAQEQSSSLKDTYSNYFSIGTALSAAQIEGKEPGTLGLVKQQFNAVTAENVMKWEIIEPVEGQFNFAAADAMIEFAESNNIKVIGHVLLWHEQTPAWVFQDAKGQPASKRVGVIPTEKPYQRRDGPLQRPYSWLGCGERSLKRRRYPAPIQLV